MKNLKNWGTMQIFLLKEIRTCTLIVIAVSSHLSYLSIIYRQNIIYNTHFISVVLRIICTIMLLTRKKTKAIKKNSTNKNFYLNQNFLQIFDVSIIYTTKISFLNMYL